MLRPQCKSWGFCYTVGMSFGKAKIDAADKAFSLYIRTRDNWTCQRCGRQYQPPTAALHNSHFVGRGKESTRFDPDNCDALCYGCHQYFTSQPQEHYAWQVARKGQKLVDEIRVRSAMYKKKDRKMEAIIWRAALKDLTEERKRARLP